MSKTSRRVEVLKALKPFLPRTASFDRTSLLKAAERAGIPVPMWIMQEHSVARGKYALPDIASYTTVDARVGKKRKGKSEAGLPLGKKVAPFAPVETVASVPMDEAIPSPAMVAHTEQRIKTVLQEVYAKVPERFAGFAKFGIYSDLDAVVRGNDFFPVFISGLSGCGKTLALMEACARNGRELVRVNIQKTTSEDDLLGGYRLVDGQTVWFDGPVTVAAERGAILLLDEIDYGTGEMSCLQNVLEGNAFLIKKIGRLVHPKPGFNIFATANTKGQGDVTGKFMYTNVLNEAFLERFAITLEQEYPTATVEQKIIDAELEKIGKPDPKFSETLVKWANANRETYKAGAVSEIISTRRLVHIVGAYKIFNDKSAAIAKCLNRFETDTKQALIELFAALSEPASASPAPAVATPEVTNEIPF